MSASFLNWTTHYPYPSTGGGAIASNPQRGPDKATLEQWLAPLMRFREVSKRITHPLNARKITHYYLRTFIPSLNNPSTHPLTPPPPPLTPSNTLSFIPPQTPSLSPPPFTDRVLPSRNHFFARSRCLLSTRRRTPPGPHEIHPESIQVTPLFLIANIYPPGPHEIHPESIQVTPCS